MNRGLCFVSMTLTSPSELRTHLFAAALITSLLTSLLGGSARAQSSPPLTLLAPNTQSTERDYVNVLARTSPGTTAQVQGVAAPVYSTGVFVRDRVPLQMGHNLLRVEVKAPDGQLTAREFAVERVAPPTPPPPPTEALYIEAKSIQPAIPLRLAEGEAVDVSFSGAPGRVAEARLPGQAWLPLTEGSSGRYAGRLVLRGNADIAAAPVQLRLSLPKNVKPARRAPRSIEARSAGDVGLWHSELPRLVQVGPDGSNLTWGLHEVRLGGPNLAELPRGTLLRVTGQRGDRLRVALAPDVEAWVAAGEVEALPAGSSLPRPVFTSLSVAGSDAGDVVTIPWPATLPVAARATIGANGLPALELDLFGTHHASTWITHRDSRRVVREVSIEQPARDRVRVRVELAGPQLWGWRIERDANQLRLWVRSPPRIDSTAASPLAGLLVAVEAGHGGPANLGAVGATGTPEKDINRWTADALQAELEAAGARVVVVREGDQNPNLRERANKVTDSGAQLFVSVHANAADTSGGYLRSRGTGMFYKHPHSRDLAATIQRRLLDDTALPDLGLIGNFNYAPIRLVTWMPAVLVEQAYVSNPEEEALLLDPAFRARLAKAVRSGLEQHLRQVVSPATASR